MKLMYYIHYTTGSDTMVIDHPFNTREEAEQEKERRIRDVVNRWKQFAVGKKLTNEQIKLLINIKLGRRKWEVKEHQKSNI